MAYMQIFSRFGLTWHREVHFSTFSGKLTFQSTRNGPQNIPFCPGPLQDTFIIFLDISPTYFSKILFNKMRCNGAIMDAMVASRQTGCQLVPTSANGCQRVPMGANGCRRAMSAQRVPTGANECQRVPTSANGCQRVPTGHVCPTGANCN